MRTKRYDFWVRISLVRRLQESCQATSLLEERGGIKSFYGGISS